MRNIRAKCVLCNEILYTSTDDTSNLIKHMRTKHPQILNTASISTIEAQTELAAKAVGLDKQTETEYKASADKSTQASTQSNRMMSNDSAAAANVACKCQPVGRDSIECKCRTATGENIDVKARRRKYIPKYDLIESYDAYYQNLKSRKSSCGVKDEHQKPPKEEAEGKKPTLPERDFSLDEKILFDRTSHRHIYKRKYVVKNALRSSPKRRSLFKASIERWRPGKNRICCPHCGILSIPIIRSRADKTTESPIDAACILFCWPLFFLPFANAAHCKEYLYCSVCYYFLGMYNPTTEVVHPNMESMGGVKVKEK